MMDTPQYGNLQSKIDGKLLKVEKLENKIQMATTLELFWNLSSTTKKDRIHASVKLVSALDHFQSQFTPQSPDEDDDPDDAEATLEALNAQDVSYSIRRLIRGLASPRESSRLGFAVALTEVCYPYLIRDAHLNPSAASVSVELCDVLADRLPRRGVFQNRRIHDGTRRTRYAVR
jgi:hypothetical protein